MWEKSARGCCQQPDRSADRFKWVGAQGVYMKGNTSTFDEYRTGYISERWSVSDNAAKALQLFEIGYTSSGAAKHLPVTESTVVNYKQELMEKIDPTVVMPIAGHGRDGSLDVWGSRAIADYGKLGYSDGVADAQSVDTRTAPKETIAPNMREREREINRGADITEIPKDLIGRRS